MIEMTNYVGFVSDSCGGHEAHVGNHDLAGVVEIRTEDIERCGQGFATSIIMYLLVHSIPTSSP